jgi:hypothetical protein
MLDRINALRATIHRRIHGNGTEPVAEPIEVTIEPSEFVIASMRANLHELARLAAMGELSDWETEALGDIAEKAIEAWRAAVAAMVGRIIAG